MVCMHLSRKQIALSSLIAASAIIALSAVYIFMAPANNATANIGLAATDKYADIRSFKVHKIGNGTHVEQITNKFKALGLSATNLDSTLPEKGDQNTLVIFLTAIQ